jgi:hypothetical protein
MCLSQYTSFEAQELLIYQGLIFVIAPEFKERMKGHQFHLSSSS